jgi:hypothetical protein
MLVRCECSAGAQWLRCGVRGSQYLGLLAGDGKGATRCNRALHVCEGSATAPAQQKMVAHCRIDDRANSPIADAAETDLGVSEAETK